MSEFAPYTLPLLLGAEQQDQAVTPLPVVRLAGSATRTAAGRQLLDAHRATIGRFVLGCRSEYRAGVVNAFKRSLKLPDMQVQYTVLFGQEIIVAETRPDGAPPVHKNPPEALIVELIWEDPRELQGVPYWYDYNGQHWVHANIPVNPGWPVVCGPTVCTINGYGFVGTNDPPWYLDTFDIMPSLIGKPVYEVAWANTGDPSGHFGFGYEDHNRRDIVVTGPDACNGVFVSADTAFPVGAVQVPWEASEPDSELADYITSPSNGGLQRYKGYHELFAQNLVPRVEVASKFRQGEYVGTNGLNDGIWADSQSRAMYPNPESSDFPDARLVAKMGTAFHYLATASYIPIGVDTRNYSPATKRGLEIAAGLHPRMRRHYTVMVDVAWYAERGGLRSIELDLHGFWRAPQHERTGYLYGVPYYTYVDGRESMPPTNYGSEAEFSVTKHALTDTEGAFYDEVKPGPGPYPVTLVATWLWGTRKQANPLHELFLEAAEKPQVSTVIPDVVVSAVQTGQNEDSGPPNMLPWGTKLGTLVGNFDTLALTLDTET